MPLLPGSTVVIDGDIERRIIRFWTPDFYKDYEQFKPTNDLLQAAVLTLDYILEKARGMPSLVNIDTCPPDVLELLSSLVGYKWKPTVSAEKQRQEIRKLVDIYLIRGTPQSVIRIVLSAGATIGEVFTPAEHIFTHDRSFRDGGDRREDPDYWRWGTYEVVADKDFSAFFDDVQDVHPAGTRWFGRQLIPIESDRPGDPDTDQEQYTVVAHVYNDDYRAAAGGAYDDTVLEDNPDGYWKLEDHIDTQIAAPGTEAVYGDAVYGTSVYGGSSALLAIDESPNGNHGAYNSETEIIAYGDAVQNTFPELQLSVVPVLSGSLRLTYDDKIAVDDGAGNISGDAVGRIDYTTGTITDLTLAAPLGGGAATMPLIDGDATLAYVDNLQLWVKADAIVGLSDGQSVVTFTESSTNASTITGPATYQPTYELAEINGLPTFRFANTKVLRNAADVNCGQNNLIVIAFKPTSWLAGLNYLTHSDAGDYLAYDSTAQLFKLRVNAQVFSFPVRALPTGEWYVVAFHRMGTKVELHLNGTYIDFVTLTGGAATTDFKLRCIGGESATPAAGLAGDIAEVLVYNNALAANAKRTVLRYVGTKYAIYAAIACEIDPDTLTGNTDDLVATLDDPHGNTFRVGPSYLAAAAPCARWHKGDAIVQGSETAVSQWSVSSSGSNGDLTQATSSQRPTFKANRLNGLGTVAFDGLDDVLPFPAAQSFGTQCTMSFLVRFDDPATTCWLAGSATDLSAGVKYLAAVDGGPSIQFVVNSAAASWAFTPVAGRWYLLQFARNGTTNTLYVDGVSQGAQSQDAASISYGQLGVAGTGGGLKYFKGEIAEWVVQTGAPSVTNTYDIFDALALKWAWVAPKRAATLRRGEINNHNTLRGFFTPSNDNGAALSVATAKNLHFGSTYSFVFRVANLERYAIDGDVMVLAGGKNSGTSRVAYDPSSLGSLIYSTDTASVSVTYRLHSGTTYALTVRRRRASVEFFVNGALVGSANLSGGNEDSAFYFRTLLGDSTIATEPGYNFDGDLGYAMVCDVALDDDEIQALSQFQSTRFAVPYMGTTTFPLRAYYNDYVERELDGPIVGIMSMAARFGLQPAIRNKSYVTIPSVATLEPASGSYTIEAWIRQNSSNGGTIFGTTWVDTGITKTIRLGVNESDGNVEFEINNGYATYLLRSGEPVWNEQWRHIVATLDVTSKRLYLRVDGNLVDADDYLIAASMVPSSDFFIGSIDPFAADPMFYRGDIGRVVVYRAALPAARAVLHFARGYGGIAAESPLITVVANVDEPLGSFGVRAFTLDSSSLDGPDLIDGEDIISVITGESWRYVLNPAGATDKLAISDRTQTDKKQRIDRLGIRDQVTYLVNRRVTITDLIKIGHTTTTATT